jgi:hypothetical protein
MKYLRLVGIAILAICAISAIAASTASAAKFTYSGNGRFSITSGEGKLETTGGTQITCKGDVGTGQLGKSAATTAELTVSFTGCAVLGKKCTSTGGTAGLIDTVKLLATFGDVTAGTVGGALIKPKSETAFLVPVKCGESTLTVTGSIIGTFTNLSGGTTGVLDVQTNLLNLTFALRSGVKGLPAITNFAGESHVNLLESTLEGKVEAAGLESKESLLLLEGSGQLLA